MVPAWQRELVAEFGGTTTTMSGTYPVAGVVHETGGPVSVDVRATSPMVPTDADASGYPAVMLEVTLTNHTDTVTQTWLAHSVHNAVGGDPHINPDGVRAPGYGGNTKASGWSFLPRLRRTGPRTAPIATSALQASIKARWGSGTCGAMPWLRSVAHAGASLRSPQPLHCRLCR